MNLKERFKQWLDTNPRLQIREVQLEVIADEFAIEFIEWCGLRTVQITKSEWANWLPNADGNLSTKELLQIFKKEKGL